MWRIAKWLLKKLWLLFVCLLEIPFNIAWAIWCMDKAINEAILAAVIPEEPVKRNSSGWEDGVAVYSKVPHKDLSTNEDGSQIKIK